MSDVNFVLPPDSPKPSIHTLGELKASGYRPMTIKEELRQNLLVALKEDRELFPGIVGYEGQVIPQIINAILSQHDFILLGLRGQAKTRLARQLSDLLNPWLPAIPDTALNEDPLAPSTEHGRDQIAHHGDDLPIRWIPREERYQEKLATPDVSMSDLIGDIDPIKAANLKLDYSNHRVIHFGIIPRANRGIFCINELPDLSPRIQVGLLNIMQERDIQIRGFPIRIPMDVLMIYTANPEDYTNRGSIITPLKDRIQSQIHTHYPRSIDQSMSITDQEAWTTRDSGIEVMIPDFLRETIEQVAFVARESEYLDQNSGVSARLSIALLENTISNAERRGLMNGETRVVARPLDLLMASSAITGKIELVYQGEQEGAENVARHLVGKSIKRIFDERMPGLSDTADTGSVFGKAQQVIDHFSDGKQVNLTDQMLQADLVTEVSSVEGLKELAIANLEFKDEALELPSAMEFILEGLHQARMIGKEDLDGRINYYDMLGDMLEGIDTDRRG